MIVNTIPGFTPSYTTIGTFVFEIPEFSPKLNQVAIGSNSLTSKFRIYLGKNTNEEKVQHRNVHSYDNKEWFEKG